MDPEVFTPEDARLMPPNDVCVGDFFIFEEEKYTIVAIERTLLFQSFVGVKDVTSREYAQLTTNHRGKTYRAQRITL